MGVSTIPASGGGGLRPRYQKFLTSGTFTLPDGYGVANPLLVDVTVIGGGGAGMGAYTGSNVSGAVVIGNSNYANYWGNGTVFPLSVTGSQFTGISTSANNGKAGGSGGIAKSQLSLTANLTITVGAAGTRFVGNFTPTAGSTLYPGAGRGSGNTWDYFDQNALGMVPHPAATAGGTSSAGSIVAAGGSPGNSFRFGWTFPSTSNGSSSTLNSNGFFSRISSEGSAGAGGSPAGTNGDTTPLLGTIAGGSPTTTPINGSYGIGGIRTDLATSTGVEGTGGGGFSVGATGAVILTWWQ